MTHRESNIEGIERERRDMMQGRSGKQSRETVSIKEKKTTSCLSLMPATFALHTRPSTSIHETDEV